jgi:hypothetical protein
MLTLSEKGESWVHVYQVSAVHFNKSTLEMPLPITYHIGFTINAHDNPAPVLVPGHLLAFSFDFG